MRFHISTLSQQWTEVLRWGAPRRVTAFAVTWPLAQHVLWKSTNFLKETSLRFSSLIACSALLVLGTSIASAQTPSASPFAPPQASLHYAPDRDYDLVHLAVTLDIDYPHRAFTGAVTNRIAALHDGVKTLIFHCGKNLMVKSCTVGGAVATFTRDGDRLLVAAPKPLARSEMADVTIHYGTGGKKERGGIMADSGLHWIEPGPHLPDRVGFWTQGEPEQNREWVPTWDYPNHLATSETTVTVPADWTVIGNGVMRSNVLNAGGKTRTFHWQMTQPHATYLLSLVAGPFDVKTMTWRGVPLMFVAPKGKGKLLESSFGDTPDMLSFFSDITGVKFAWPKYAEDAMYDFGGGMENVSATTLPESALTDPREGFHTMASLNSHELAHQWFGDLVTCKDWGHIWLNESFATFFEALYLEHSRGEIAYAQEIEGDMQGYFGESRRYKRPIATDLYPDANAMFDSHTYPKGGAVLHTLRRMLGDKQFFAGIHAYLLAHQHTPVDSYDLCRSMTDATGVDLEPFFAQWIFKPGHPVIDTTWTWDEPEKKVLVTVKQTQDTKDGTPIYDIRTTVGLIIDGKLTRVPVHLHQTSEVFTLDSAAKPDAVLLDPDHDFLREIPTKHWAESELPAILKTAPNPIDRAEAMAKMLSGTPSESAVQAAVEAIRADTSAFPALSLARLGELKREDLRSLFRSQLKHASFGRREQAVRALALLPKTAEDTALLAALVNDQEPYAVVTSSLSTLATWEPKGSLGVLTKATDMPSLRENIRTAAYSALAGTHTDEGLTLILKANGPKNDWEVRRAALQAMGQVPASEPRTREALRAALQETDFEIVRTAVYAVRARNEKDLLPALQALQTHPPAFMEKYGWFKGELDETVKVLSKP